MSLLTIDTMYSVHTNLFEWAQLQGPAIVASPYGGVNIEEIAKASPSYIYKDGIDITTGKGV